MKMFLGLFLAFVFTVNSVASPLVFKVTKEIKAIENREFVKLATFDASKYKQIRIVIERSTETNKKDYVDHVQYFALEDNDEYFLGLLEGYSSVIDSPPSQITLKVNQTGTFRLYVYANQ